ncbi:hypothetical protein OGATHE_002921 [Ogataea polymorpha]|uniref:Uncharacterized protein n=1 Tax=Ogataea polymorpha TaxID=460523 RepID=A0A9P8PD76_9ASCO|nr:hypothetical protein OGATHE_002921 [Ogataea polymorpha]
MSISGISKSDSSPEGEPDGDCADGACSTATGFTSSTEARATSVLSTSDPTGLKIIFSKFTKKPILETIFMICKGLSLRSMSNGGKLGSNFSGTLGRALSCCIRSSSSSRLMNSE